MTATVTYLPGVTPPDQLAERRAAERLRREAGRCTDPNCGEYAPNHRWTCGTVNGGGPEEAA